MENEENSELNVKKKRGDRMEKKKITVPHNEFIEMFNVSNSDIKEGNKNVPFKAVLQIGSSKLR